MIKKIGTVAIYVENQQKAKSFWTEMVGFEVKAEFPMGPQMTWLEVGPVGAETALVIYPKAMMENHEELKSSIVFQCEDIQGVYESMSEKGVTFHMPPQKMQFGSFAQFSDEDGNVFGLKE